MKAILSGIGVVAGVGVMAVSGLSLAFMLFELVALRKGDTFLFGFFGFCFAVGVLLVRWSSPALFARAWSAVAAGARWFLSPYAIVNPVGLAGWVMILCGAAIALWKAMGAPNVLPLHPFFFVMAGLLFYMLITTMVLVVLPHWWPRAVATLLTVPVLLAVLVGMAEFAQEKSIGEASLAFLGPVMFHWGVVPASGLLRLMVRNLYDPGVWEPGAGKREPRAGSGEPGTGAPAANREPGA